MAQYEVLIRNWELPLRIEGDNWLRTGGDLQISRKGEVVFYSPAGEWYYIKKMNDQPAAG